MSLQVPTITPDTQTLARLRQIDWSEIFNWKTILPDLITAGFILLLAVAAYRVTKLLTRRLEREIEEPDPLVKRVREQRAKTLANVINHVALVLVIIVAGLTILGVFIPITPLLAAFGIFGLAVSFGAQSLVRDIISGVFMLIEGQFDIGDVVRVGDTAGLVERITLRTTILRDLHGIVHVIPNGEVKQVSNFTKTWSRAVVDVDVAYKEDVDRVLAVLREVGQELYADPDWRPLLIEEPEVLGIETIANAAVTIRVLAKTLPIRQWDVAREFRRRIKNRFDAEGIEIPSSRVTFFSGETRTPSVLPVPSADEVAAVQRPGSTRNR